MRVYFAEMKGSAWVRTAASRTLARLRTWSPAIILAIGWVGFLVFAFPGEMTWDSVRSVIASRTQRYTDASPPALAILWSWIEHVVAGSFGMLLLQSSTLLGGIYLVLRRTFAPRAAAWLAVAVLLFPPVMMPMAFIWEQSVMAGLLMLGTGLLLSPRQGARIAGLGAMLCASAVRYDAYLITLPLIVLLFRWGPRDLTRRWPRYAQAVVAWLAVTLASSGVNRVLTDPQQYPWHVSVALHDIAGTLAFADGELPDAELNDLLAATELLIERDIHAAIRRVYAPRRIVRTSWSG